MCSPMGINGSPETHTVKRALHIPFTDCTNNTIIQLDDQKLQEFAKRRGVFHLDNVRTIEVYSDSPETPGSWLSFDAYYQVFIALQSFLNDKKLVSSEKLKKRLLEFLANRDQEERGIMNLPLKWQQVIKQNEALPKFVIRNLLNKVLKLM
ncbi:hypothetical protein TNCV_3623451 [Trichonephila clavipes]|nr:hypothetical protein TNCV_3623451 [Trichonephila clavipes]